MMRNRLAMAICGFAVLAFGALAFAEYGIEECDGGGYECENCFPDPVFVQPDRRRPVTVDKLRRIMAIRKAVASSFNSAVSSTPEQEAPRNEEEIVLRIDLNGGWRMGNRRPVQELRVTALARATDDTGRDEQ